MRVCAAAALASGNTRSTTGRMRPSASIGQTAVLVFTEALVLSLVGGAATCWFLLRAVTDCSMIR